MEKKKILIIEDDKAISRVLELKLQSAGFLIEAVYDGRAALEAIAHDGYAAILLDLILPDVDGFKVLETFRSKDTVTPIVVLSNLQQEEDRKRVEQFGVSGYYVKSQTSLQQITEFLTSLLA